MGDEAQLAGVARGIAVTEVIVAEYDVAFFGDRAHKAVIAGDMLGHAVDDMEEPACGTLGDIDLSFQLMASV